MGPCTCSVPITVSILTVGLQLILILLQHFTVLAQTLTLTLMTFMRFMEDVTFSLEIKLAELTVTACVADIGSEICVMFTSV